jgi:hypothetical protein
MQGDVWFGDRFGGVAEAVQGLLLGGKGNLNGRGDE